MTGVRIQRAVADLEELRLESLAPCPHCGGEAEVSARPKSDRTRKSALLYRVECVAAGLRRCKGSTTSWELTELKARKTWRTLSRRMETLRHGE